MAEPSYYPLNLMEYPLEDTTSPSPEQPFKEDSNPQHLADTVEVKDPGLRSTGNTFLAPLCPQLFREGPSASRSPLWRLIKTLLKMVLTTRRHWLSCVLLYCSWQGRASQSIWPLRCYAAASRYVLHLVGLMQHSRNILNTEFHSYYQRWYHFY